MNRTQAMAMQAMYDAELNGMPSLQVATVNSHVTVHVDTARALVRRGLAKPADHAHRTDELDPRTDVLGLRVALTDAGRDYLARADWPDR